MKRLLQKLVQALAYLTAAIVILLAIAVGLFRLLLPRLPEYQEEIKDWANAAVGLQVEFSGMNALWRLSGPELSFANARLRTPDTSQDLLTAEEVSVGVSLIRLLRDRELVVDRIVVRETNLQVRQNEDGVWEAQGMPLDQLLGARSVDPEQSGDVLVLGEDIHISYWHPGAAQAVNFSVSNLSILRDEAQIGIDATLALPEAFGDRLDVSMTQRLVNAEDGAWQVFVEGDALSLPGWSQFQPGQLPSIVSGRLDLSLWLEFSNGGVHSTTTNFSLSDFAAPDTPFSRTVDVQGRIEYSKSPTSWLLAANDFRISTVEAAWPISSWQLEVVEGSDTKVATIDANASYINLDDIQYFAAWLPLQQQEQLAEFEPSGEIRDASLLLGDLNTETVRYDLSAELQDAGIASRGDRPGVRGFSGRIRADGSGGRLEIDSTALRLDLVGQLTEVIEFDDAMGTVIWRRNDQGITVLSDSVRIRNPDLDSESSLQISIPADGSSPVVDLDSVWSVNDIDTVERYLPEKLIHPALYRWLTSALVSGSIPHATTRLSGPIDKFPFDNDEGVFRIEAQAQNTTLRYAESWPDVANMNLDIVVDGMRLFSHRNSAVSSDNTVKDAKIEIDDLRNPILTIEAFATGSLQSIVDFSRNSPIASVFGGHLARVSVDGEASFDLQLTYPIKDRFNYDFSTRIRTSNGTIRLQGFNPPITELNGAVLISRDAISSDALYGTFLGQPSSLELRRIEDPESPYGVVLDATGTATAQGLVEELGAPLAGIVNGAAIYSASVRFPNAGAAEPGALEVTIDSQLEGLEIALPVPLKKAPQDAMALHANLTFPAPGQIESKGTLSNELRWDLSFEQQDELWDFDRGELAVGGGSAATPEIRGLHISGDTPEVVLQDWLDMADGSGGPGIGDRIRSIDLAVGNLFVFGQQLRDHRAMVDRGGQEWVVQIDGEQAVGTITVPYDLDGGRPLVLDMQKLILPGTEVDFADRIRNSSVQTDPRNVPAITISAAEFALGERHFGSLTAEFVRTPNGLRASNVTTQDESFSLTGAAGWVIDNTDDLGQRSYITGKLLSTDITATMGRLNYEAGLAGDDMEIDIDLSFSGGPREDFMAELDGEVGVRLGAGQLDDVEPGPGRVFGLMSIVALPRRLSLDFSDVLDKGFGFDTITGSFRLVNGDAFTCDLSLEGPAADVGIVGRAGLATRDYSQTAVVSANVGNTLPIVGAVMAGPQVAAALLIFSQIFKKPLQEMGQVYYGIDGSWDEPLIESTTPIRFAQDSGLAGCIDQQG